MFKNVFKKLQGVTALVGRGYRYAAPVLLALAVFAVGSLAFPYAEPAITAYASGANSVRKLPVYCVDTLGAKKVSVSFDAAWGADDTSELLRILAENDVKATFFLCGFWVDKYPDMVKLIYEAGHDIGSHGNKHLHGAKLSLEENKREIALVAEKIKALLGIDINLFRPPFGEYNNTVITAAEELGFYPIQWDVDSLDWKNYGVEREISTVLNHKKLRDGSIILFHNDADYTPAALDTILKGLKEKGYEIVPISQLIYRDGYKINHEGRQVPVK